jgi:DNA-binding SARP family transcriptional activator
MTVWQSVGLNYRIIIIHPNFRHHRYLLSTLLSMGNALYLRFDEEGFEDDWLDNSRAFEFIILDEFDRLPETLAGEFLERVLSEHPSCRIVLFSRHLPDLAPNHRAQASIFPIDEEIGLIDYFGRQAQTIVEFFGFGSGAIAINGKRVDQWQDETQLLIVFYLLEKGRARRETLLSLFWEDISPKARIKGFHNIKTRLKELLSIELVVFRAGFYQLNPDMEIVYDVSSYQRLVNAAYFAPPSLSETLFAQAQDVYKGDFLQNSEAAWVRALRNNLCKTQAEIQTRIAQIYIEQAQEDRASAWYSFAFKHNPARDDVVMALMRLFLNVKMPCHALKLYQRHKELLREKHGISPNKRFEALLRDAEEDCNDSDYSSSE